jgi:hypothetical protein
VIDDSLCIGQRRSHDRDERVLLFVKMRAGYILSPALISQIRITIRRRLSARHVPAYIFEVSDIPVGEVDKPFLSNHSPPPSTRSMERRLKLLSNKLSQDQTCSRVERWPTPGHSNCTINTETLKRS